MLRRRLAKPTPTPKLTRRTRLQLEYLEVRAVPARYALTVLPDASNLSFSGAIAEFPVVTQGAGSLTTRLGGDMIVDFDASAGSISFQQTGTRLVAQNSGNWAPRRDGSAGTEAANLGGRINNIIPLFGPLNAAVRDAVATVFTPTPLPTTDLGGGIYYYPSTQSFSVTAGTLAYNHLLLSGSVGIGGSLSVTNQASEGLFLDLVQIDPALDGLYLAYVPVRIVTRIEVKGFEALNVTLNGTVIALGVQISAPGGAPGTDGFVQPALVYLATQGTPAAPVIPTTGSVEAEDPFRLTPTDMTPAPAARAEAAPTARVAPVVADQLFADPFAAW